MPKWYRHEIAHASGSCWLPLRYNAIAILPNVRPLLPYYLPPLQVEVGIRKVHAQMFVYPFRSRPARHTGHW